MTEMSQLYSRVFLQILDSSIAEDYTLRHVFEDFLKLADHKTGIVDMTRQALSRRLNIPADVLNEKISILEASDTASRDASFDGRRLERLDEHRDWGWRILNWEKYEAIRNRADVYLRVLKHREKEKPKDEDLPKGFPATEKDAREHAAFIGCPPEFCVTSWAKARSRGGCDAKGQPIRSFRHHVQADWSYAQSSANEKNPARKNRIAV